jgi:hypothetical protein
MELLAHPLRLSGSRFATVTDGTEAADCDAVARMVLTHRGEVELVPAFGISDLTFSGPEAGLGITQLNACASMFGPPVTVSLDKVKRTDRTETARFLVERKG